ncbi:hypothetical protein, partial [Pseudomonas umsongensis]|uniref:hypothetical protein n=1 Tax=Pseudomonas umsongensis TaxID=198618 RepID=UPI00200A2DF5
ISYGSPKQVQYREEYMLCVREWSEKAQAGLSPAVQSAKSDAVKVAIKDLYASWKAYFSTLRPGLAKNQYQNARGKLEAELLSN